MKKFKRERQKNQHTYKSDFWEDLYLADLVFWMLHILGILIILPEMNITLHLRLFEPHEIHVFTHVMVRGFI